MTAAGSISGRVVDAAGKGAIGYVSVWDQRPEMLGTWSGRATLEANGTFVIYVPPGKYFVSPDPTAKFHTGSVAKPLEVKAGQRVEVELTKP